MKVYQCLSGGLTYSNNLHGCLHWAADRVNKVPHVPVKIVKFRAGEKQGFIVAEVTPEGIRFIEKGRPIKLPKQVRD